VVHSCNPNIWETEAGGLRVQVQPGLQSKFMPQKYQSGGGRGGVQRQKKGWKKYGEQGLMAHGDSTARK
jgi:hypothetical protein